MTPVRLYVNIDHVATVRQARRTDEPEPLAAARAGWPGRRLVVVFQPHRYTRTHDLFDDFIEVLSTVDVLLLCEVYAAGEAPISGADGRALTRGVRARGQVDPVFVADLATLPAVLGDILQDGDILLTLGAGDIGAASARLAVDLSAAARGAGRSAGLRDRRVVRWTAATCARAIEGRVRREYATRPLHRDRE